MLAVEMKDLGHIDAARDERGARRRHIRDDQEHSLSGAGHGRRRQMNRAWRSGRCQLHRSKVLPDHEIGVERPAQRLVEGLRAIDVGYGDRDDLELQIDGRGVRKLRGGFIDRLCAAHCDLVFMLRKFQERAALWLATFDASSPRLSPSTRLNAGNGWMTSASVDNGVASLIASTSSPRISPARGVTSVAPISTRRSRSPTSFSAPR